MTVERERMTIVQIPAGPIETNAFLVVDPATREALIIDAPPEALADVERAVEQTGATPVALVITHTHWDHIGDTAAIAARWNIPVLVHVLERTRLEQPSGGPAPIAPAEVARTLAEGDEVTCGERGFRVLHTPGHSPGQISLYSESDRVLLGGDTLFPDGYGRVDIPGASVAETVATMTRLLDLPDDVMVLTGHGRSTTIGRERPWMTRVRETGELV